MSSLAFAAIVLMAVSPAAKVVSAPVAPATHTLGDATLRLGLDLFNHQSGKPENAVLSPLNVVVATAMIHAGARGETARQLATALRWEKPAATLQAACHDLVAELMQRTVGHDTTLAVASSVWLDRQVHLLPAFDVVLRSQFGAPPGQADFHVPAQAAEQINRWSGEHTAGRISHLVEPSALQDAALVLASALYFKAPWGEAFRSPERSKATFTLRDKTHVEGPVLHKRHLRLAYAETPHYEAIEIPYAAPDLAMVILLPRKGNADSTALQDSVLQAVSSLAPTDIDTLQIPVFSFEAGFELKEALQALGVQQVFTDKADLSGMNGQGGLKLDRVIHKAFIAVDETGTEAAAATAQTVTLLSYPAPLRVIVNRPFFFILRDTRSGVPLFIGRVERPTL